MQSGRMSCDIGQLFDFAVCGKRISRNSGFEPIAIERADVAIAPQDWRSQKIQQIQLHPIAPATGLFSSTTLLSLRSISVLCVHAQWCRGAMGDKAMCGRMEERESEGEKESIDPCMEEGGGWCACIPRMVE